MSQRLCRFGGSNVLVYLLVILFGMSSWIDINGMWVELPILVQNLPEGWDLPSYMTVIIQVANVAPLLYTFASWKWPGHRVSFETPVILTIISLGAVACLLLTFFWNVTSEVAGTKHSTALLGLQFLLALVDCTSSVAFLPFMYHFQPQYMTAYFIGEGLSGLIPSLISLGQGAGSMTCVAFPVGNSEHPFNSTVQPELSMNNLSLLDTPTKTSALNESTVPHKNEMRSTIFNIYPQYKEPRFSIETFFLCLLGLMIISDISFLLLKYWGYCKKECSARVSCGRESEDGLEAFVAEKETSSFSDSMNETFLNKITSELSHTVHHAGYIMKDADSCNFKNKTVAELDRTSENRKKECKEFSAMIQYKVVQQEDGDSVDSSGHTFENGDLRPGLTISTGSTSSDNSGKNYLKASDDMPRSTFALFLLLTAWLNALSNGVLPPIQTYSCLPYGIMPYHLSVTLSVMANPLACLATSFIAVRSARGTLAITAVGTVLAVYVVWTAGTSPTPPLVDHMSGTAVLVLCWVLVMFCLTYAKVGIATAVRQRGRGPRGLLWIGAFTQLGSLGGALVTFILVSVFKVFTQGNPCM